MTTRTRERDRERNLYNSDNYVDPDFALSPPPTKSIISDVSYVTDKKRKRNQKPFFDEEALLENAQRPLKLIPITLDLDLDGFKYKDSFTWNFNEVLITPKEFSIILAEDIDHPQAYKLVSEIEECIKTQCAAYVGAADEESPQEEYDGNELSSERIIIKLDMLVEKIHLRDKFEWSLFNSNTVTPEVFALQLCSELSIGGEFFSQISHSIREQICYARLNYDETMLAPDWSRQSNQPIRLAMDLEEWEPIVQQMEEEDIDRLLKERERSTRRMRRVMKNVGAQIVKGPSNQNNQQFQFPPPPSVMSNLSTPGNSFWGGIGGKAGFLNLNTSMIGDSNSNGFNLSTNLRTFHPTVSAVHSNSNSNSNFNLHNSFDSKRTLYGGEKAIFGTPSHPFNSTKVPYQNYNPSQEELQHMKFMNPRNLRETEGWERANGSSKSNSLKVLPPGPESKELLEKQLVMLESKTGEGREGIHLSSLSSFSSSSSSSSLPSASHSFLPTLTSNHELNHQGPSDWMVGGSSPPKRHRGFGASAKPFNEGGNIEVGAYRKQWRCTWCWMSGVFTPTLRKGPTGSKTLCNACGIWYGKHGSLPQERFREYGEDPI